MSEAAVARAEDAAEEADIVVRMIHACGQVSAAESIEFAPGLIEAARDALNRGAPILCDAEMVAHGITRARLPAGLTRPGAQGTFAPPLTLMTSPTTKLDSGDARNT